MNKSELQNILSTYDQNKTWWRRASDAVSGGHSRSAAMTSLAIFTKKLEQDRSLTEEEYAELNTIYHNHQASIGANTATEQGWAILNTLLHPMLTLSELTLHPSALTTLAVFRPTNLPDLIVDFPRLNLQELTLASSVPELSPHIIHATPIETAPCLSDLIRHFELPIQVELIIPEESRRTRSRAPAKPAENFFKNASEYQSLTVSLLGKKALKLADFLPSNHARVNYDSLYYEIGKALIHLYHTTRELGNIQLPDDVKNAMKFIIEQKLNRDRRASDLVWNTIETAEVPEWIFSELNKRGNWFYYKLLLDVSNEINPPNRDAERDQRLNLALQIYELEGNPTPSQEDLIRVLRDATTLFNASDRLIREAENAAVPAPRR